MRTSGLLILFILLFCNARSHSGESWGLNYFGGKILIHTPKIYLPAPVYSQAIEISHRWQSAGTKPWHQRFGFPETAINMCYSINGSNQLGTAVAIYPSIQFRIIGKPGFNWYGKIGGGLAFATQRWQRIPPGDSMNNIIGSHLNNFSMFQSGLRITLHQKWNFNAGVHFYHLSNAAARSPNFGINTLGVHAGLAYAIQGIQVQPVRKPLVKTKNPLWPCFSASLGLAEAKIPDGPLYRIYTLGAGLYKMYRNKNRMMIGSDAIMNSRMRAEIHNAQVIVNGKPISPWQFTAYIGHEFLFGRTGFPISAGWYLNRPLYGERYYQKLGLNYHFLQPGYRFFHDAFLSLVLKTHLIQAQYAELGLNIML
ncbi:MAG TPA: acyloxyacyl hydrolase [Chitinophagaceae bacterium]|nr:acyloxyacyl hydrolase [Chitinophagaceae bacterium]